MGKSEKWSTRTKTKKSSKSSNFLRIFTNESLYFPQFSGTKAYFISVVEEISLKTEKMNFLSFLATFMICLNFF